MKSRRNDGYDTNWEDDEAVSVPDSWSIAPLEMITKNFDGQRIPIKSKDRLRRQGQYPYFGASGIIDTIDEFLFDGEFLLIAEDGANLLSRSTPIAFRASGRFWVNNHAHVVQTLGGIPLDYLEAYLNGRSLEQFITGSAQPKLTQQLMNNIPVPIPPLAEQLRIVKKIRTLLGQVNRSRDCVSKIPAILKRFRQAVLAAACSGRLTEDWREKQHEVEPATLTLEGIHRERSNRKQGNTVAPVDSDELPELPDGWAWAKFGVLLGELQNGISTKPELSPPGVSVLRISSVRSGRVSLNEHRFLPHGSDLLPEYGLRDGDLLFTRYNGSLDLLGVCGMVRGLGNASMLYPDKLMRVRFDHDHVLPAYAELFFQSAGARDRLTAQSRSSAGQQGISGADIKSQPFALPPFGEQVEIIDRVSPLLALADTIEDRLGKASMHSDKLTQSILAKAFRGELVPTEAELARREGREYEPASVLLERVKRERAIAAENVVRNRSQKRAKRAAASDSSSLS